MKKDYIYQDKGQFKLLRNAERIGGFVAGDQGVIPAERVLPEQRFAHQPIFRRPPEEKVTNPYHIRSNSYSWFVYEGKDFAPKQVFKKVLSPRKGLVRLQIPTQQALDLEDLYIRGQYLSLQEVGILAKYFLSTIHGSYLNCGWDTRAVNIFLFKNHVWYIYSPEEKQHQLSRSWATGFCFGDYAARVLEDPLLYLAGHDPGRPPGQQDQIGRSWEYVRHGTFAEKTQGNWSEPYTLSSPLYDWTSQQQITPLFSYLWDTSSGSPEPYPGPWYVYIGKLGNTTDGQMVINNQQITNIPRPGWTLRWLVLLYQDQAQGGWGMITYESNNLSGTEEHCLYKSDSLMGPWTFTEGWDSATAVQKLVEIITPSNTKNSCIAMPYYSLELAGAFQTVYGITLPNIIGRGRDTERSTNHEIKRSIGGQIKKKVDLPLGILWKGNIIQWA